MSFELITLVLTSVQTFFIFVTCLIAAITLIKNQKTKKRTFLMQLESEFISNDDLFDAMHIIEFKSGWFKSKTFYSGGKNSTEKKIDRLFTYLNKAVLLYKAKEISKNDFEFFKYKINAVFQSSDACDYLTFIEGFAKGCRRASTSFQALIDYGRENGLYK